MKHEEFKIGTEFRCGDGHYRCTDVGSRTVVAIRIDGVVAASKATSGEISQQTIGRDAAEADGWFNGPPYAVTEIVFDEEDQKVCDLVS